MVCYLKKHLTKEDISKLKLPWDTTVPLLQQLKISVDQTNVYNNVEEVEVSHMADENVNWCNHLGKYLESFIKS